MIDLDRTHLNYDLVQSELNFYQQAKGFEQKSRNCQNGSHPTYRNDQRRSSDSEYDMSQNQVRLIMDMNGLLVVTKKDLEEYQK